MDTERRSITRPDSRNIDFLVAGPADGLPLDDLLDLAGLTA